MLKVNILGEVLVALGTFFEKTSLWKWDFSSAFCFGEVKTSFAKLWIASCLAMTVGLSFANGEMLHSETGITFDTDTKLLWQDNLEAKTVTKNWQGAIDYCENLKLGGYDDWKLPDYDTLTALYPKNTSLQNLASGFYYWSSTPDWYSDNVNVWVIPSNKGFNYTSKKTDNYFVRCVRDSNFDTLTFSSFRESNQAKGLKYNDDLTPLVKTLQATKTDHTKWLFAVAIEKYDEADAVTYAKNSANAFVEATQKRFGISERNTYSLIDEKATSASIKDKLELMLKNVKEGDSVYFYYSGHGIPNPKEDGEPYILPKDKIVDFVTRDKEFMVRNIYKQLSDSRASKVVAFMDSCFSGSTDGVSNIKGVAAGVFKTKKVEFDKSKMVVLTAGTSNQFSNVYMEKGHRLFSYFLTKAIIERSTSDIDSIYKEVAVKVKDESFKMGDIKKQEPQIDGNSRLGM